MCCRFPILREFPEITPLGSAPSSPSRMQQIVSCFRSAAASSLRMLEKLFQISYMSKLVVTKTVRADPKPKRLVTQDGRAEPIGLLNWFRGWFQSRSSIGFVNWFPHLVSLFQRQSSIGFVNLSRRTAETSFLNSE